MCCNYKTAVTELEATATTVAKGVAKDFNAWRRGKLAAAVDEAANSDTA